MLEFFATKACGRRRQAAATVPPDSVPKNKTAPSKEGYVKVATAEDVAKAADLKERGNTFFKQGDYEEALEAYTAAVQASPRDGCLWLNRSITNRQLKNWEDAALDAEVAVELQPSNAKAYYSRAVALQQMGEQDKALCVCTAGLARQPDSKVLRQLRSAVEQELQMPTGPKGVEAAEQDPAQGGPAADAPTESTCPADQLRGKDIQDAREEAERTVYAWRGRAPTAIEREGLKQTLVSMFREKYKELKMASEAAEQRRSALQTDQYQKEQKQGLKIQGGHRPMKRPEAVDLPKGFRSAVGVLSVEQLAEFSSANKMGRYLLSVYGEVFDVSDRPDKYGPDGPYAALTGSDTTWGLAAGVDEPGFCNRCYDMFKAKDLGKDKLAGLCSWLAWYETEYGAPVGRLEPYTHEWDLPVPPLEEVEECSIM